MTQQIFIQSLLNPSHLKSSHHVFVIKHLNTSQQYIKKGFTPKLSGTLEHTAQMAHIINTARTKQRSIVITLLDPKNAFGEVHHNLIYEVLEYHHIPNHIKNLIGSLYTNFQTSILTEQFNTPLLQSVVAFFKAIVLVLYYSTWHSILSYNI